MQTDFYFTRVRDVKAPSRGTSESAGLDFFVPNDFAGKTINPGESVLIPSGIKCAYQKGHALIFFNKSGVSTKRMLTALACVCDSDYQGELHISLCNVGTEPQEIKPGEKIAQFLLMPIQLPNPMEVSSEQELFDQWALMRSHDENTQVFSERGSGGFGSTDNKADQ